MSKKINEKLNILEKKIFLAIRLGYRSNTYPKNTQSKHPLKKKNIFGIRTYKYLTNTNTGYVPDMSAT